MMGENVILVKTMEFSLALIKSLNCLKPGGNLLLRINY